jgi:hypothetical protein
MTTAPTPKTIIPPTMFRTPGFIRLFAFACIALLGGILAAPMAHAAGADGVYKITKVTGSFTANGQKINLPANLLSNALAQNGRIAISNGKAPIYGAKWSSVFNQFNSFGFKGKVKVTGPKNYSLKKVGKNYVGKSSKPVTLSLNGSFNGQKINLLMKVGFTTKISKDTLTMTLPISVTANGISSVQGKVVLKGKK